jgi:AraC family transcriptional regulator of adaptative response/methylated-DNA-[protein]-cysteine methyltransferase
LEWSFAAMVAGGAAGRSPTFSANPSHARRLAGGGYRCCVAWPGRQSAINALGRTSEGRFWNALPRSTLSFIADIGWFSRVKLKPLGRSCRPGFESKTRSAQDSCRGLNSAIDHRELKGRNMKTTSKTAARAAATTADPRWAALLARDRTVDGRFVYSVVTTGVYCRPSCAARRARPEHVAFHTTPAEAERAGFRPCRRCRPDEPPRSEQHAATIARLCRLIESSDETPSLETLAAEAGLSVYHLHRLFKAATGLTPKAYAAAQRARRVRTELARSDTVTEAIYGAGYNSNGRFYAQSNDVLGMTPSRYRAGGVDTAIRFAIGECSLGAILVAATELGVCAILIGDDPDALARDLQDRFPRAELTGGDAQFEQLVATVIGLVEAPRLGLDLPLDVRGTAFQQRVWQALREIPAGTTESYVDLARRIGAPKSVRAVAQACGANALAVAIPCHRVVRNDGTLAGYRWGVERKRALLAREAAG